jgi:hypothetical protein
MTKNSKVLLRLKAESAYERKVIGFYNIGRKLLPAAGTERAGRMRFPRGLLTAQAKLQGVSEPYIRKAADFAGLYTSQELNQLLLRWREAESPIGIGIIFELIQVKEARARKRLAEEAARSGWSSHTLRHERQRRFGKTDKGRRAGRRPKLATGRDEVLLQLRDHTERWLRYTKALSAREESRTKGEGPLGQVLLRKMQAAQAAMTTLQQAANKHAL